MAKSVGLPRLQSRIYHSRPPGASIRGWGWPDLYRSQHGRPCSPLVHSYTVCPRLFFLCTWTHLAEVKVGPPIKKNLLAKSTLSWLSVEQRGRRERVSFKPTTLKLASGLDTLTGHPPSSSYSAKSPWDKSTSYAVPDAACREAHERASNVLYIQRETQAVIMRAISWTPTKERASTSKRLLSTPSEPSSHNPPYH